MKEISCRDYTGNGRGKWRSLGYLLATVITTGFTLLATMPTYALPSIDEYRIPSSWNYYMLRNITRGPDNNMWFAGYGDYRIGRIAPDGSFTKLIAGGMQPFIMTDGPGGNIWFTESKGYHVSKMAPAGDVTTYNVPQTSYNGAYPQGIAAGYDGNIWYTEFDANKISKITENGVNTEYTLPNGMTAYSIVSGLDGNIWFTEAHNRIGKITPNGVATDYAVPTSTAALGSIARDSDGNIWFTENDQHKIGKITPQGTITEYPTPAIPDSYPGIITAGPRGTLWFTESGTNKIGVITTAGVVTEYTIPSGASATGIALGPDGNIWFAENDALHAPYRGTIGKINLPYRPPSAQTSVTGTITQHAIPVADATVTAICNGRVQTDIADAQGAYSMVFPIEDSEAVGPNECSSGATVRVTATKGSYSNMAANTARSLTTKLNLALVDVSIQE